MKLGLDRGLFLSLIRSILTSALPIFAALMPEEKLKAFTDAALVNGR